MIFRIGQKVVCVDVGGLSSPPWNSLHLGSVYTVVRFNFMFGDAMVDVAEVPASRNQFGAFFARRFRPVVTTDISIFTSMLNNVPLHDKEHA